MPTRREIDEFYLHAMLTAGWVSVEPHGIDILPANGKRITYKEDEWEFVDEWHSNGDRSAGTVKIFYGNAPVFLMSYGGMYPEAVIPHLKEHLREIYQQGFFIGGRGTDENEILGDSNYIYTNHITGEPAPEDSIIIGKEVMLEIYKSEKMAVSGLREVGYHHYLVVYLV